MALSEPVAVVIGALITGLPTGAISLLVRRRSQRNGAADPDRVNAALEARVTELDERINAQWQSRVTYLEAQCENKDRTIAALQKRRGSSP